MSDQRIDEAIAKLREARFKVMPWDEPYRWGWAVFATGCLSALLFGVLLWYQVATTDDTTTRTWSGGSVLLSSAEGSYCELRTADGTRYVTVPGYYKVPRYVRFDPGTTNPATLTCNYPVALAQGGMALLYRMYGGDLTGVLVTLALIMFGGHFGPANAYRARRRRLGRWRGRPQTATERYLIKEREKRSRR